MNFESLKQKICKLEFHNATRSLLGGSLLDGLLGNGLLGSGLLGDLLGGNLLGGGLLDDLLGGNLLGGDLLDSDFLCYTKRVISFQVSKVICVNTPIHHVLSPPTLTIDRRSSVLNVVSVVLASSLVAVSWHGKGNSVAKARVSRVDQCQSEFFTYPFDC
jgi:hypothetical protein